MTRDAVARYQAALGVPATGYFGPMTRDAMAMHFQRNNWLGTLSGTSSENSGVGGGESSDLVGIPNGSMNGSNPNSNLTGVFSETNPGTRWNGVWYPNSVNMSVSAPSASNSSSGSSGVSNSSSASGSYTNSSSTGDTTGNAAGSAGTNTDSSNSTTGTSGTNDTYNGIMGP